MATLAKLLVELGLDGEELVGGLEKVSGTVLGVADGINVAIGGVIVDAAQQGAEAMAGFVTSSVDAAGTFESKMNTFAAVTGTAVEDAGLSLDQFESKFLELGAQTAFSAAEAQEAAIALVKGGVDVTAVMGEATEATLNLAGAGSVELANAADIVAKQLGVWGEEGVTATEVADKLAQAANASTVDVDELAVGLANVGGSAKVAGVDFGDLVQTMALIAPGFSSASDAGTSLKTMIGRLVPSTNDAIDKFHELGLITTDYKAIAEELGLAPTASMEEINRAIAAVVDSQTDAKEGTAEWFDTWNAFTSDFDQNVFYDAQGNFLGMENAAAQLQEALSGLSEEQKIAALNTMFGADAIRAASALANAGADGFNAMGDSMAAAGSAAEQAAKMQQGYKFALDSLFGSIETAQIVIGGALLPVLTALLNEALIPGVNAFTDFVSQILAAPDPIAALVAAINTAIPGFTGFLTVTQQVVSFVGNQFLPIGAAILAMVLAAVIPAFVTWATAAWATAAANIAAMLPILVPIALIGAAVGLLVAAWTNNWGDIQGKTAAVVAFITPAINKVGEIITWLWSTVLPQASGAVSGFVASVIGFFANFQTNVGAIWDNIYARTIGTIVRMVTEAVTNFDQSHNNILTRLAKLNEDFNLIWDTIKQRAIATIVTLVTDAVTKFVDFYQKTDATVTQLKAAVITRFVELIAPVVNAVMQVYNAVNTHFTKAKTDALAQLGELVSSIGGMASRFFSIALTVGKAVSDGIAQGIKSAIGKIIDAAVDAAQSALDAAKDALGIASPSKRAIDEIGKPFSEGIIIGAESMISEVGRIGAKLSEALIAPATGALTPAVAPANAAPSGVSGSALSQGEQAGRNITIHASYLKAQSEGSIKDDLRLYEKLYR